MFATATYFGEETLKLPEATDIEDVRERIGEWRKSGIERRYNIKEQGEGQIVLESVWRSAWHYVILCFAVLILSFLVLAGGRLRPGLQNTMTVIMAFGIGMVFIFCWFKYFKGFVRLSVNIQNGTVKIEAEGSKKRATKAGLNTLITAIERL